MLMVDPQAKEFWEEVATMVPGKNADECMQHYREASGAVTEGED